MSKKSGIYYIQNTKTGELYIGQSIDVHKREQQHFGKLKSNTHFNNHLQNSYNKYGEDCFIFSVIEYCDPSQLDDLEQKYIDFFNVQNNGFNICEGGTHRFPNNTNENHGMWRNDISNDTLKELDLGDYNSTQLAQICNCSRRTINRRLKKIFGENYSEIVKEKQKNGALTYDHKDPNIKDEDILHYYEQGLNSVEIGKIIGCADGTVMDRLKALIPAEHYELYKKRNVAIKMAEMRKTAHTKEAIKKNVESRRKYHMWDVTKVHYSKQNPQYDNNPIKRFRLRYCGRDINIGVFVDFVTPMIISGLIEWGIGNGRFEDGRR